MALAALRTAGVELCRWTGQALLIWASKCPPSPECPPCPQCAACPACPGAPPPAPSCPATSASRPENTAFGVLLALGLSVLLGAAGCGVLFGWALTRSRPVNGLGADPRPAVGLPALQRPGGGGLWHQRRLLGRAASSVTSAIIATPDGDVYEECVFEPSGDLQAVRFADACWPPLAGLPRGGCYRFRREPLPGELAMMREQAVLVADDGEREARRLRGDGRVLMPGEGFAELDGGPVAVPGGALAGAAVAGAAVLHAAGVAGLAAAAGGAAGPGLKWVLAESGVNAPRGSEVAVTGACVVRGARALVPAPWAAAEWALAAQVADAELEAFKGREAAGDARLIPLVTLGGTRERRPWREAVKAFSRSEFSGFAVPGPRRPSQVVETANRLFDDMWGVQEHGLAMSFLEIAAGYDGLDVVNLASVELLMRKAQLVEFTYSERGPAPPPRGDGAKESKGKGKSGASPGLYDEGSIFLGAHKEFGDTMVAPELLDYVSKEVEREASVMKQVRKAREERALAVKAVTS